MSELSEAINEMRTMREAYDQLAGGVISAPVVAELEEGKAAIITAINAMGGTATVSMSLGELAQAIRALILVQLGDLEYNIPIENVEEAINLASTHCTKYVNDYTTKMYTPLIVDEWQAVEEVRYKKLLDYNFDLFSSDERKRDVYALTNCHELKRVIFDVLRTISISDNTSQFVSHANSVIDIQLPELKNITLTNATSDTLVFDNCINLLNLALVNLESVLITLQDTQSHATVSVPNVFSNLSSVVTLNLNKLKYITCDRGYYNYGSNKSVIFSNLNSIEELELPELETITTSSGVQSMAADIRIFTGLHSAKRLVAPKITSVTHTGNGAMVLFSECYNLEYVEIGHVDANNLGSITENMRLNINPTNTYNDAEKLAALNASIREHWFANLRDYTGGTAHTLTLMSAFVAYLEPETIQVATDKNWTIVTF